jgi:hypothetical protein
MRHAQHLVLPYAMLSGVTLFKIREKFKLKKESYMLVLLGILLITTSIAFPLSLFRDSRTDKPFAEAVTFDAVEMVPNGCTIISWFYTIPISDSIQNNQRKTINPHLGYNRAEEEYIKNMFRDGCVFYFDYPPCEDTMPFCKFISENVSLTLENVVTKNNQRIKVYRATLKG